MNFMNRKRIHSIVAGVLATVILTSSLTGCSTAIHQSASSQVQSSVSSQTNPSVSGTVPSATGSQVVSASSASAQTGQKASAKKTLSAKTKIGNQALKKIAADPLTQNNARLNVIRSTAAAKQTYAHIDQREGYNFLADLVSRDVYKQIFQSVYKLSATPNSDGYYPTQRITVSGLQLSEAQLRVILLAFLNDNPQIFWLANAYSYVYSNGNTYIQLYSVASQAACNDMIQKMNQKVGAVIDAMPSGLSELDRELYLFNYITKNCTYNQEAVTNTSIWQSFSAYGAMVDGKAVCEGYARAMQLLSSYSGLQCMLLSGQSNGVNHMWNVVKVDGNWYHLDVTWCDNDPVVYNYFNLDDAAIMQTRTIFPSASTLSDSQIDGKATGAAQECNLTIPSCTSTAANYFKAKGTRVSDTSNNTAVVSAFSAAAKSKSPSVSFYVDENTDYDQIIAGMTTSSPYQIVTCISAANSQQGAGNRIDISNLKYLSDKTNRGITVFLNYK